MKSETEGAAGGLVANNSATETANEMPMGPAMAA